MNFCTQIDDTDGKECALEAGHKGSHMSRFSIGRGFAAKFYPPNWPRCPGCGRPALDGHITCGDAACDEGGRRR